MKWEPIIAMFGMGFFEILVMIAAVFVLVAFIYCVVHLMERFSRENSSARPNSNPPIIPANPPPAIHCPQCGQKLPPNSPESLCPSCLIRVGLGSQYSQPNDPTKRRSPAKTTEELARFFPQLEILELVGQGGMGSVYKARQKNLERFVALKILPIENGRNPAFAERFAREAKALARLNHPNIVSIYESGQTDDFYYFLMEFVDGLNLRQMQRTQRLSPKEALSIVPKICEALQFAHDEGIVHRDIKPENILIDKKGRVKIADFGLSKLLGENSDFALTEARHIMGTPHYMAPEQVEKPQNVDHRADIFSLGVVFYELLTGELPLGRFAPPSQKVQMDVRLDEVVLRSLEKDVERRYQQVNDLKTEMDTIATTPASVTILQHPPESTAPPLIRKPLPGVFSKDLKAQRRKALKVAIWIFVITVIAVTIYTFSIPRTYLSTARISVEDPGFRTAMDLEVVKAIPEFILHQSHDVVESLNLAEIWERRMGDKILSNNDAYAILRNRLLVTQYKNTTLFEIKVYGESPEENVEIANAIAEVCVSKKLGGSFKKVEWIDKAVPDYRRIPIRPNKYLNIFIGILAGIGLGIVTGAIVFWRGYIKQTASL